MIDKRLLRRDAPRNETKKAASNETASYSEKIVLIKI